MKHRECLGRETILCNMVMLDIFASVKNPYNCMIQRVNTNFNYGLWLIAMYQYWFINFSNVLYCLHKRYMRTLYFLFNFSVSLKLL